MSIYLNQPENGKEGSGFMVKIDHYGNFYGVICKPVFYYKQSVVGHFAGSCIYFEKKRLNKRTLEKYNTFLSNRKEFLEKIAKIENNSEKIALSVAKFMQCMI